MVDLSKEEVQLKLHSRGIFVLFCHLIQHISFFYITFYIVSWKLEAKQQRGGNYHQLETVQYKTNYLIAAITP